MRCLATIVFALAAAAAPAAADDDGGGMVVGVDYYPEQWPESEMAADMAAIKQSLGANLIRVGEFMWHTLEPADNEWNFTLIDSIVDHAEVRGAGLEPRGAGREWVTRGDTYGGQGVKRWRDRGETQHRLPRIIIRIILVVHRSLRDPALGSIVDRAARGRGARRDARDADRDVPLAHAERNDETDERRAQRAMHHRPISCTRA